MASRRVTSTSQMIAHIIRSMVAFARQPYLRHGESRAYCAAWAAGFQHRRSACNEGED